MSILRQSRRSLLRSAAAIPLLRRRPDDTSSAPAFTYPIRLPGRILGDGFVVRHGYATEHIPYYPGWWHTGENWYVLEGNTAGAEVCATAAGEVRFAGFDYPGAVVIIRHAPDLYSMSGHLDHALVVEVGQWVERGQLLGAVLLRSDDPARSHLHFEVRTFYQRPDVNGDEPRYGVRCGFDCPPGPGYWPMAAPEHPSDLGYRNPVHAIARLAFPDGIVRADMEAVVAVGAAEVAELWTAPTGQATAEQIGVVALQRGQRLPLLAVAAGELASTATGAEAYSLWYRVATAEGGSGWTRAAVASAEAVGSDGRASAVRFNLLPAVAA